MIKQNLMLYLKQTKSIIVLLMVVSDLWTVVDFYQVNYKN